jgi:transcriptional regulator with XRE-family HTH domain
MPEDKPDRTGSLRTAVARRITALRQEKGLSLSSLAARAGIGKGTLSELEAGTRNATLETLYALAGPLGVPLTGLVGDARLLTVRLHDDGGTTEIFWLTIAAGGTRISPPHAPGTTEHLRLVRGSAQVGPRGAEQPVDAGGSRSWSGDTVHCYGSAEGAEGVLVIETPRGPA